MLIKVSPRWMVNDSQIRCVGCYKTSNETAIVVQFIDNSEATFDCGDIETRNKILKDIENTLCISSFSKSKIEEV